MFNRSEKKLIPLPILVMAVSAGVLSVLLVFNIPLVNAYEKMLVKNLFKVLIFAVFGYFILRNPISKMKQKLQEIFPVSASTDSKDLADGPKKIPEGFKRETVKDKGFSFCYPSDWFVVKAKDPALLKEVREQMVPPGIKGARNFNISVHDIRMAPDMQMMYKAIIDGVLKVLKGAKLEYKQEFEYKPLKGMRYKVIYKNMQGLDLCCYQTVITTAKKAKMLIFTFTCQTTDFTDSKPLFDTVSSLVEIFE